MILWGRCWPSSAQSQRVLALDLWSSDSQNCGTKKYLIKLINRLSRAVTRVLHWREEILESGCGGKCLEVFLKGAAAAAASRPDKNMERQAVFAPLSCWSSLWAMTSRSSLFRIMNLLPRWWDGLGTKSIDHNLSYGVYTSTCAISGRSV